MRSLSIPLGRNEAQPFEEPQDTQLALAVFLVDPKTSCGAELTAVPPTPCEPENPAAEIAVGFHLRPPQNLDGHCCEIACRATKGCDDGVAVLVLRREGDAVLGLELGRTDGAFDDYRFRVAPKPHVDGRIVESSLREHGVLRSCTALRGFAASLRTGTAY